MKKWIVSSLAGIAGAVVGLSLSANFMISKLFLDGIEVDLSDPTAVEWALVNPTKSEWQTYLMLGRDSVFTLPGPHWTTIVSLACALLFFSATFLVAVLSARRKAMRKNPFQKATSLPADAQNKKVAEPRSETRSGAPLISVQKSNMDDVGHQQVSANGQKIDFNGAANSGEEGTPKTAQESLQGMTPEQTAEAANGGTAETVKKETEGSEPEKTEQLANDAEILEDEIWQTHYDYDDVVRASFDKLRAREEYLALDFVKRFMEDPKGSDPEEIAAQVLEEEKKRKRFSDNEIVEAAHVDMMEFSEEAAAEFRRVISILGEDVDLSAITEKIRKRFPNGNGVSSGPDPLHMTESQIISELRAMGLEIIAPAGGPYSVKNYDGSRITRPYNLVELREFLKEKRCQ